MEDAKAFARRFKPGFYYSRRKDGKFLVLRVYGPNDGGCWGYSKKIVNSEKEAVDWLIQKGYQHPSPEAQQSSLEHPELAENQHSHPETHADEHHEELEPPVAHVDAPESQVLHADAEPLSA